MWAHFDEFPRKRLSEDRQEIIISICAQLRRIPLSHSGRSLASALCGCIWKWFASPKYVRRRYSSNRKRLIRSTVAEAVPQFHFFQSSSLSIPLDIIFVIYLCSASAALSFSLANSFILKRCAAVWLFRFPWLCDPNTMRAFCHRRSQKERSLNNFTLSFPFRFNSKVVNGFIFRRKWKRKWGTSGINLRLDWVRSQTRDTVWYQLHRSLRIGGLFANAWRRAKGRTRNYWFIAGDFGWSSSWKQHHLKGT